MSYGGNVFGGVTYTGAQSGRPSRPADALVIPAFDAAYSWTGTGSMGAYGQVAWGGRGAEVYPSAGLGAVPDPIGLAVTIPFWWSFADAATVVRVNPDGTKVGVRDGAGVGLRPELSRRNRSTNPSARDGLVGYAAGPNTNISRLSGLDPQTVGIPGVRAAVRATAVAAGSCAVGLNVDAQEPDREEYQWQVRCSSVPAELGLAIDWYDEDDLLLETRLYPTSDAVRIASASRFVTATAAVGSWPTYAVLGVVRYRASGMATGGQMDVTARLREDDIAGVYFDGDSFGATWIGTPGLSHSDYAETVYLTDSEAPLDTPIFYELTSGMAPGYVARSETVVLPSTNLTGIRQVVLTHPGKASTIRVWVESEPATLGRELTQGVFKLKGRRYPVVVSEDQRGGDTGTLVFIAEDFDERDRLLAFLDDGSPLLVRTPAAFGHPPDWWLSFGTVSIKHWANDAARQLRRIEAPFVQVDRPAAATRPLAV